MFCSSRLLKRNSQAPAADDHLSTITPKPYQEMPNERRGSRKEVLQRERAQILCAGKAPATLPHSTSGTPNTKGVMVFLHCQFHPRAHPPCGSLVFLLWQQMKQLLSQLWVSGSQMTFSLCRLSASLCPKVDTMDPLMALLCLLPLYPGLAAAAPSCPQNVNISGGTFTLSHGWAPGSVLTYSCPLGRYPSPASRLCKSNGQWQTLRSTQLTKAVCKHVRCPAPVSFENGMFTPRLGSHPVGSNLSFQCEDGFTLRGSAVRQCRPNGMWDGETAVCDNGAGHCPNPGIPVGAVRMGSRFGLGDKVSYRCSSNLVLTGSAERECQSDGVWSGTEPICRQTYSYDFPEDVAPALGASLSHLLGATNPTQKKRENLGRKIQIQRSGHLNLYLLLDASQSVKEEDFHVFKESAILMVDRIFSFEINVSVAIITFASKPKIIMSVLNDNSRDATEVINSLNKVNYKDHENGTGTNTYAALNSVHIMMNNQMDRLGMKTAAWQEIRHAIILLTDGKSNMGGSPKLAVDNIKEILNINQQRSDYLDIYAIGVGKLDVDWRELNELGSKKDGERHAFILQDTEALYQVFEHMLDISQLTDTICGVGNMSANASVQERTPWHVIIKPRSQETCRGALISDQWVLTAAHCFRHAENSSLWRVTVGDPNSQWGKEFTIEKAVISSEFDVFAKKNQGILEFYGDDIALLKLAQKVKMSTHARPICLPCTVAANLALRRPPGSTCRDHESELLNKLSIPAHFVALNGDKLNINLKTGTEWTSCIEAVSQDKAIFPNLKDVREVVTDQFLCSGTGKDDNPCKGESGGAVFLERRHRFFQVGLVSWGLYNPCSKSNKNSRQRPPKGKEPRDFHINLFRLQPWLRQHLEDILNFLPL